MIQNHSHALRRAHKHTSVHMLPKTNTRREKCTCGQKTPVWSNARHRRTEPVTCQLPERRCLHWEDIKALWCGRRWHNAAGSGAAFPVALLSYLHSICILCHENNRKRCWWEDKQNYGNTSWAGTEKISLKTRNSPSSQRPQCFGSLSPPS